MTDCVAIPGTGGRSIAGNENITHITLWDFGGQLIYYSTHPMYFSKRCVYLLVFNLDMNLTDIVEEEGAHQTAAKKTVMGKMQNYFFYY